MPLDASEDISMAFKAAASYQKLKLL